MYTHYNCYIVTYLLHIQFDIEVKKNCLRETRVVHETHDMDNVQGITELFDKSINVLI